MKGIPNFYPRGSGIVVTGRFQYTAEMCDCKLCGEYIPKKGCGVPRRVCLEERIAVGVASVKEIMNDTMSEIKHGSFLRRVRRYIKESEAIPMTFISEKHRLNFDEALSRLKRLDRNNYALMSAIYLMTADPRLWFQSKRFVENHGISFGKLRPKNCSEESYPLYCAATARISCQSSTRCHPSTPLCRPVRFPAVHSRPLRQVPPRPIPIWHRASIM